MAKQLMLRALTKVDKQTGRHADGDGLFLKVIREDRKFWSYRYRLGGRETELSLAAYPEVSLDQARAIHAEKRALVLKGEDPQEGRRSHQRNAAALAAAQATTPTFGDMAEKYIAAHEGAWRNPKHRQQWRSTIATYCGAFLSTPVNQIDTDTVLAALEPIWTKKPETARRVRGRIEKVLGAARSRGHIDKNQGNAAIWRDHLEHNLPKTKKLVRGHHKALDYRQVPVFMADLRTRFGVSARALELLVLTAARSGEVFGMKWDEVDFDHAVTVKGPDDKDQTVAVPLWVVPAERMKMGKEHRVPLSGPAVAILKAQFEARGDRKHVFPGARPKAPLSTMSFEMILRRMKLDCTVHGFRSSFRDWVGDVTRFPREVAEAALAHAVGDDAERAYRRSDALMKRRELMELWARYCAGDPGANVISIGEAAKR